MGLRYDLTGEKSGTLIAKKYIGNSKWLCICQVCQNEVEITTDWFHKNQRLGRDGCKHVKQISIGDKFGYLTVIEKADDYIKPKSKAKENCWLCECICGRTKKILESNLKSYKSLSCGICMNRVSIPEKMIYYYLSQYFDNIKEQYRPDFLNGKEIDIFIPSLQIGIEYDGYRWHKDADKDILKNNICKQHNITLIRVREPKCPKIENLKYCIITPKPTTNGTHMTKPIKEIIEILNKDFNCEITIKIDCNRDNADICKNILSTIGFNSLEYLYPEIAKEWDYVKNYPLTPDKVAAHSGKKAYWICPNCKTSYPAVISSRTAKRKTYGCRNCKSFRLHKKVACIELNKTFDSVKEAANYVGKSPCSITSACKGYVKTCGGYHWKYVLEDTNKEKH